MATRSPRPPTGRTAQGQTQQPNPPSALSRGNRLVHNRLTRGAKHATKVSYGAIANHLVNNGNVTPNGTVARHSESSRKAYSESRFPLPEFLRKRREQAAAGQAQTQQAPSQGGSGSPTVRPAAPATAVAGNGHTTTAGSSSGTRRV